MKQQEIQEKLSESGLEIFSKAEFKRLLQGTKISAQKLLERYTRKGILARLKGGLYALKSNYPESYSIANKLYSPSYVSFETALSYYGMIPETVYSITSATTKKTREYIVQGQAYKYHKIKKGAFAGYGLVDINGKNILFADKEKVLADYLYFVFLKKKPANDRLEAGPMNMKKFYSYVSLFDNKKYSEWAKNAFKRTIK